MNAVSEAVPATAGVLIQFPLYGAVTFILTKAVGFGGHSVSDLLASAFVSLNTAGSFPVAMGAYSAIWASCYHRAAANGSSRRLM